MGGVGEEGLEGELPRSEERGVDAEPSRHDPDEGAGSWEGEVIEGVLEGVADVGVDPPKQPAEDDEPWVQDVHETGDSPTEPAPDDLEGGEGGRRARLGLAEDGLDAVPTFVGGVAGPKQERSFADLSLPAADGAAAAGHTEGVDRQVTDLPPETGRSHEWSAANDEAASDTDLPGDEEDVLVASRRPAAQFGEGPQVGVVGNGNRGSELEGASEVLGQGNVPPAEVWGKGDQAVASAHDPDDGNPDADEGARREAGGPDDVDELGEVGDDLVDREVGAGSGDPSPGVDDPAEPDDGCGEGVDADLQGDDDGPLGVEADAGRWPSRRADGSARGLDRQARLDELADEAPNGTSGQAGADDEGGPSQRPAAVELTDDGAEVRPANRLAALRDGVDPLPHR